MNKNLKRLMAILMFAASGFSAQGEFISPPETRQPAQVAPPKNVLFLGNSLTFMPDVDHPTVPAFVEALLSSKDYPVHIEKVLAGGHTLENHWNEGKFQTAIASHAWTKDDIVFIQPFSVEALELPSCFAKHGPPEYNPDPRYATMEDGGLNGPQGREHFLLYAKKMIKMVRNAGATPVVIEPHIYDSAHPWLQADFECAKFPGTDKTWWGGNEDEFQRRQDEGYTQLQRETGVELLRIGPLWNKIRHANDSIMQIGLMYQPDHYHPTYMGALLSALVIASRISDIPTTDFKFCPAKVTPDQEAFLQKLTQKYQIRFENSASLR